MNKRSDIRNIAIVAHVDHGKTTLVDAMLKQAGTLSGKEAVERVMDSNDLEKERGITILAKNTSIQLPNLTINIVDTPGHMDFGGEVERTLQMVEGFLLLVDAAEGCLPGTRFVLQKALSLNLQPIVVINKIDRKDADIEATEEKIHDLFLDLAKNEKQLDFPVIYGSSRGGYFNMDPNIREGSLQPLFDLIEKTIPEPTQADEKLRVLITNLDYSDFLGRIGVGRIFSGQMSTGQQVVCCNGTNVSQPIKVTRIFKFDGVNRVETSSAMFGDIVAVSGFEDDLTIGTTICDVKDPDPLNYVKIDEPTLSMYFGVNTSPFCGKEGSILTSRQIRDRLFKETKTNVALKVEETSSPEVFKVSGRGQLHLAVLIENMRREGFELQVSAPEVIYKDIDGKKCEPYELLTIDVDAQFQGTVMSLLGNRKAILETLTPDENKVRMEFKVPARGLLGLRGSFLTETRGTGTMNSRFLGYEPYAGEIPSRNRGALISMEPGKITGYALDGLQDRGILFISPGIEVYEGMIIGEHSRENDLDVNPTKEKKLTNMRASGSDDAIKLSPPRDMDLEKSLDWIRPDELLEITPTSLRMRKKYLKAVDRKRFS